MSPSIGMAIRNMGPQSTRELMLHAALACEDAGFESLWVTDHIAIPPDNAEGSGGRYLDPLACLAWMGGHTQRIKLGTGVLVLPYRPSVPTGKWVATVQELTNNRVLLGVGIGWLEEGFRAVGADPANRAKDGDAVLDYLNRGFANHVVTENGQDFIFSPQPERPPIVVGGFPPHALERAIKYGEGWFAINLSPEELAPHIRSYKDAAAATDRPAEVTTYVRFDEHATDLVTKIRALADVGVDRVIGSTRYTNQDMFDRCHGLLAEASAQL
jgi:alkanesulfonate monooxygenase SsuD/methylene tetrahydromethanopterin reductase-like flavin-dependent oxidoreductase (luciferase family)